MEVKYQNKERKQERKEENIFKQDIIDAECKFLNKQNFSKYFYNKDQNNNIIKYYKNQFDLECELVVYTYLLNKRITNPICQVKHKHLCYITNDKISLYTCLTNQEKFKVNIPFILNELFSFVNTFKKYNFLHGNLNLHNIFIDAKNLKFSVIDLTNAFILEEMYNDKAIIEFFEYWDFFSLYKSLKNQSCIKNYDLDNVILNYINLNVFKKFTKFQQIYNE